jgi:hypothetical protein
MTYVIAGNDIGHDANQKMPKVPLKLQVPKIVESLRSIIL